MANNKHITGAWGEDIAVDWLQKQGFQVLCRNWRKGSYELDVVCVHKGELVFVEVKTRGSGSLESAREALGLGKQKSLIRAAQEYIKANNAWDLPCRFDLVCVESFEAGHNLEHISNAFELSENNTASKRGKVRGASLDSGNSNWQPW